MHNEVSPHNRFSGSVAAVVSGTIFLLSAREMPPNFHKSLITRHKKKGQPTLNNPTGRLFSRPSSYLLMHVVCQMAFVMHLHSDNQKLTTL